MVAYFGAGIGLEFRLVAGGQGVGLPCDSQGSPALCSARRVLGTAIHRCTSGPSARGGGRWGSFAKVELFSCKLRQNWSWPLCLTDSCFADIHSHLPGIQWSTGVSSHRAASKQTSHSVKPTNNSGCREKLLNASAHALKQRQYCSIASCYRRIGSTATTTAS